MSVKAKKEERNLVVLPNFCKCAHLNTGLTLVSLQVDFVGQCFSLNEVLKPFNWPWLLVSPLTYSLGICICLLQTPVFTNWLTASLTITNNPYNVIVAWASQVPGHQCLGEFNEWTLSTDPLPSTCRPLAPRTSSTHPVDNWNKKSWNTCLTCFHTAGQTTATGCETQRSMYSQWVH